MKAMIVMVDGAVLGTEPKDKRMSVGVPVPRYSLVDESMQSGVWSYVQLRSLAPEVAVSQPLATRGGTANFSP
jgi:hypothetical protein